MHQTIRHTEVLDGKFQEKKYVLTFEAQIHKHVLNKMVLQYELFTSRRIC
jgi:hypothetical protein